MSKKEFGNQFKLCMSCMKDVEIENYETGIRFTENFWSKEKDFIISLAKMVKKPVLIEMWNMRYAYFDPKFEFNFVDALGKAAALATVQLDHENGARFGIKYIDKDNIVKHPLILHTSPSGAIERIIYAILEKAYMEKTNSLPLWLSPVQVRLIPLSDKFLKYAEKIAEKLEENNIRVDIDDRKDTVPKKVRAAELEWIPFIIVIGEKEVKTKKLALRNRKTGKAVGISISALMDRIQKQTKNKPFKKLNLPRKLSNRPSFGMSG